jgi:SAM-dependent methyltransferase
LTSSTPEREEKERVVRYYDQEAAGYVELYRRDRMEQEVYPANDVRLELVVERLQAAGCRRVLDVGCGSGAPLARFLREGFDAIGFDFSPKMVEAARQVLREEGLEPERASWGDLERAETLPAGAFDGIVATGVFPHNLDDAAAYANLRSRLEPAGIALVEYRNALMALYSLNRYSEPFFWHELLRGDELPEPLRSAAREYLAVKFDTPVDSVGRPREIEYTDILARFHNPLTLGQEVARHGLALERLHYYHFHAAAPVLEKEHRRQFWEVSLQRERADDWRGMFVASAFVAELRRADG